ncbi:glutathione S-transferase family protein [Parachitinimonas caeni]|uniref:Glutathione S-transferase family protein n=1 Tax=Parachitinimonas caeni TaxID=3031301 RepID=A0ABT7E0N0_9NEIS|nr:glutathione S-transferase family protein [Parachitinimonas caeni]MDK2125804.1 glutathione S-transferase family protein [Parachitinimonas caeni]
MTLTIYGTARSRAFRVLWAAEELGLTYQHEPIDWREASANPVYLRINPAGSIPAIDDAGFVMAESLAINVHLAHKTGRLLPEAPHAESLLWQWTLWAATSLEAPYTRWASHSLWLPESLRDADKAQLAAQELTRPFDRLELALTGRDWLIGNTFSIADLNVASVINLIHKMDLGRWPNLAEWLSRCLARPAYAVAASRA